MFEHLSWAAKGIVRQHGLPFVHTNRSKDYGLGPSIIAKYIFDVVTTPYGSVNLIDANPVYQNGSTPKARPIAPVLRGAILHPQDLPDQHTFNYFHKVFPMYDSKSILDDVFYYTS